MDRIIWKKTKPKVEAVLESTRTELGRADKIFQKNYKKGLEWQDNASHYGDFIVDIFLSFGTL